MPLLVPAELLIAYENPGIDWKHVSEQSVKDVT